MENEYRTTTDEYGTKYWHLKDKLHREDGPAIEFKDGTKFWLKNGKYHREDGSAIEYKDGTKSWWINGINYKDEHEWLIVLRTVKLKIVLDSQKG